MTAVANPPSLDNRSAWGANGGQGRLSSINPEEVARLFMPRKSAQRANSSSSISSNALASSLTTTTQQTAPQANGISMPVAGDLPGWNTPAGRKKPQRTSPWPPNKSEPMSTVTPVRSQSVLGVNGTSATSSLSSLQQPSAVVPSQHLMQTSQQNGVRQTAPNTGESNPVLYLLSMNGTFERKTIQVPFYPETLRIGRQTNAKTVPTPTNGFFDSKVLSRQHAEIWAERNGKIWIRDVRSSNGTFVNGARLSAENRDSEPHELQTQDHLELGIDIVSEDQKTVVHHKVAAKVEHAGFLGPSNVLDMSFGDIDPTNCSLMLSSQNGMQLRSRTNSQGSMGSNGRLGPPNSINTTNASSGQQRQMNFWLTPITTEQIVKRLTHEMRSARLQTADLNRTEQFFDTLLSKEDFKDVGKGNAHEAIKHPQVNNGSLSFKMEGKPRFSDPPAPPPQQPLPEKPDFARPHIFDPSLPSLKRSNTERPKSVPNASPDRNEPTSRIVSLMEALAIAHKEIDAQNARMRDLEDLLKKEREAREVAEAKQLELESSTGMNGFAKGGPEGSAIEEAFESLAETVTDNTDLSSTATQEPPTTAGTNAVDTSTTKLHERIELMMVEMREMKNQMEAYRQRAEKAEAERDVDRKTLAEMVEKIQLEEQARRTSSMERGRSRSKAKRLASKSSFDTSETVSPEDPLDHKAELANGKDVRTPTDMMGPTKPLTIAFPQPLGIHDHLLYHSTPYASMLGVVLLGMGLMAYMNSWQKVER